MTLTKRFYIAPRFGMQTFYNTFLRQDIQQSQYAIAITTGLGIFHN